LLRKNRQPFIGAFQQKILNIIELALVRQLVFAIGTLGTALAFMTSASLGASGSGFSPIKETGK
jgi:hypothetical protein